MAGTTTPAQEIVKQAFNRFEQWCAEYGRQNPDADLSILELAELYSGWDGKFPLRAETG